MSISLRYLGTVQVLCNKMSVMKQSEENFSFLYRNTVGSIRARMDSSIRLHMSMLSVTGNITPKLVTFKVLSLSGTMFSSALGRRISLNYK